MKQEPTRRRDAPADREPGISVPSGRRGCQDFILAAFDEHDLPDREANLVITAVMGLVSGIALSSLMRNPKEGGPVTTEEEWWAEQEPYLLKAIESGRYSRLRTVTDEDTWSFTGLDVMRHGLGPMLDGLEPRMEQTRKRES